MIFAVEKRRPERSNEAGGVDVVDVFSGLSAASCDPFLIWHELPRRNYKSGEMPGAPMHPHRARCPPPSLRRCRSSFAS